MAMRVGLGEHLTLVTALRLSFVFGPRRGITLDVSRRLLVGRGAHCDVHVIDEKTSREHCAFEPDGDALFVADLGSRNGTWVNGARITARTRLAAEDTVGVGETLVLVSPDAKALRTHDGDATLVLAPGKVGLTTAAATPGDETLEQAGRLVLEAALAPDRDSAARALVRAFASGLSCDEAVLCARSPEGALRPLVAHPAGASISLNDALVELALTQRRTVSVEEHQLRAKHDEIGRAHV
jgi:hypothetical protein